MEKFNNLFDVKRLIIIGNGFDLKCGLKSRFEDYYNNYSEILEELEEAKNSFDKFKDRNNGKDILRNDILSKTNRAYFGDSAGNLQEIRVIEFKKISFWEYYFYKKKNSIYDWADVEKQLQEFLLDTRFENNQSISTCLINQFKFLKRTLSWNNEWAYLSGESNNYSLDEFNTTQTIMELTFVLIYNFHYDISLHSETYFYEFLFKQLNKFENNFKAYMRHNNTSNYSNYMYANKRLMDQLNNTENSNVLSFNYTLTNINVKKNIYFKAIHGSLSDHPIIGIDSKDILPNSPLFRFTKTYRIMTLANDKQDKLLPKSIRTIAFYGHSLAPADYSYFQSIFDYYNIYENDITLAFYYSIYDTEKANEIRRKQFNSVSRLISEYGDTFHTEKGKNLMHKMLLEGRLIIKKI